MIRPDDDDKPFVARWNTLTRALLVQPSVKLVARSAMDYADLYDGTSCRPSGARLARNTGYSEKTVRDSWAILRALGMAERVGHGNGYTRKADEYALQIPEDWKSLPMLGPKEGKFTCINCEKLFTPQGNCTLYGEGDVRYNVRLYCFCPKPRKTKGREGPWCFDVWNQQRKKGGHQTWTEMGRDVWKLFREARSDDW